MRRRTVSWLGCASLRVAQQPAELVFKQYRIVPTTEKPSKKGGYTINRYSYFSPTSAENQLEQLDYSP